MYNRTLDEVQDAMGELIDKVWYNRCQNDLCLIDQGKQEFDSQQWDPIFKSMKKMEDKYGEDNLLWDDFEWGMVNGKLSALRWVLGDKWDNLYT